LRDLTKAFFGFSWAMSLFALEQMGNLLRLEDEEEEQEKDEDRVVAAFDRVTEAISEQLGERTRSMYDSGDRLQREVVDLVFDTFRRDNWKPDRLMDKAAELADRSAERLREWTEDKEEAEPAEAAAKS
jgi:hypothetical protein